MKCKSCGGNFISDSFRPVSFCPTCYAEYKEEQREERKAAARVTDEARRRAERSRFEEDLKMWNVKTLSDISPAPENILFIIGNGFDLVHGVRSSYYSFRDFLGKNSSVRQNLEDYLTQEDIWADFETSLAHYNAEAMISLPILDDWLDMCDAYDEDASVASFTMAYDMATQPMREISEEMPRRFRKWIERLNPRTNERPFAGLFCTKGAKVLNFNYTEFVEALYHVPADDICYIHGCRKRKEELVLGHRPGEEVASYDFDDRLPYKRMPGRKQYLLESAQSLALDLMGEFDDSITKDSKEIIKKHAGFFDSLEDVTEIFVIGHSLSDVDLDYFRKVFSSIKDRTGLRWYFGCYGANDLERLRNLMTALGIEDAAVTVFRTDDIDVTFVEEPKAVNKYKPPKAKRLAVSPKKVLAAERTGNTLSVRDLTTNKTVYEVMLYQGLNMAVFLEPDDLLLAWSRGSRGIHLFGKRAGEWIHKGKLAHEHSIINERLRKVYYCGKSILFVYNNRIMRFSLDDGRLVENQSLMHAKDRVFKGQDISLRFGL